MLGGQERDLYVLGEIHKRPDVDIAFVYDKDANAVGMEIAEILGIERVTLPEDLGGHDPGDYIIVAEPREQFAPELDVLSATGARVLAHAEALELIGAAAPKVETETAQAPEREYSIEDALSAFERLFDREKLLDFLLDVAVQATGAEAGSIMMYSEEAGELYIAYATGLSERVIRNTRQRLGEGIAGVVAKERKGKLIRQAPGQGVWAVERDRSRVTSAISVPLIADERLLGVLNVSSGESGTELTRQGLSTLERLSVRISRLLSESMKLQEARVRHREMSLRQSVGELSERSISSGAKFSVISNYLGDLVGADGVEIFVSTHEGDWLVLGGSTRRLSSHPELVRCEKGALSRAYLDKRLVILNESGDPDDHRSPLSSFVFVPLVLGSTLGVLMLEFSQRHRLDEFLAIRESVALELSRFIASEKRERRLRREATALGKVSDGAPLLLTCRTLDDLCDYLARLVADALECERVSVRVMGENDGGKVSRYEDGTRRSEGWPEEDEERFLRLKKKGEPYRVAFLNYASDAEEERTAYHSLMAVPINVDDEMVGGIIAYDRRPSSALEDATFTDLDRAVLDQIISIAAPILRSLASAIDESAPADAPTYQSILSGNMLRMKKVLETEMARADRYHHAFSLLVFKITPLEPMFQSDRDAALELVDEITKGIQTRTRKTDFGAWIRRDTFAMLSLEGSKRVKFLVSRLLQYMSKDLAHTREQSRRAGAAPAPDTRAEILVGHAPYPGASKTPEALLAEAEKNAAPPDNH